MPTNMRFIILAFNGLKDAQQKLVRYINGIVRKVLLWAAMAAGNGQPPAQKKADPERERRVPERSPDRELEGAREQPNPSPVLVPR